MWWEIHASQWMSGFNNPTAHTALDDIIPCVDPTAAQQALSKSREVTFRVVDLVNQIVANISNANFPAGAGAAPLNYNQSGPSVPLLCNPYNSNLTNRTCGAGEVDSSNATEVWLRYECQVSASNVCSTEGRLTPMMYTQMIGAVNISYGLYNYGPFLVNLADCTFLRDIFTHIYEDHCPYLNRYSRWVYVGLAMASAAVALSLIFWVVYARERRHRKYTKLVDSHTAQNRPPQA